MAFFKRLSSFLYGGANSSPETLVEYTGLFYHYSRGQWSCLFNECEIAILKKPDVNKYSYCVQVTRIIEDESQAVAADDDDEPNSYEFPITVGLELYREEGPLNGPALSWRGTQTRFMFEFDQQNDEQAEQNVEKLQQLLCQCIYESKFQQHHSNAEASEVNSYCRNERTETMQKLETKVKTVQPTGRQQVTTTTTTSNTPTSPEQPTSIYPQEGGEEVEVEPTKLNFENIRSALPTGEELFRSHCSLYLETGSQFNLQDADVFVLMNKTRTTPVIEFTNIPSNHLNYNDIVTFFIVKNDKVIISQIINSDMYPHFFNEQISFIWFSGIGNNYTRWSIRFDSDKDFESFRDKFTVLHYEASHQTKFKGKKDDVSYLARALTDDYEDPNIIFDTDDGFTTKDLEDFSDMKISSSQEFTAQEHDQLRKLEAEIERQNESDIVSVQSDDLDEEDEDSNEVEDEEHEEDEEEEEEEESEGEPGKFVKRPDNVVYHEQDEHEGDNEEEEDEEEDEDEEEEEEDQSDDEQSEADIVHQKYISTRTPVKKPPPAIVESESEDEDEDEEEDSDESEEEDEVQGVKMEQGGSGAKNSELLVGYKDRSYVVRGSNIGVFNTGENDVQFNSIIKGISDKNGQTFSPKRLMLQNQDSSLLMLNPTSKNKVFKMDLNRPDIVQEWDLNWKNQNTVATQILPQNKFDETTNRETFVGMNGNNLFLVDPRQGKDKITQKFYGGSNPSSINTCGATSDQGHIALGTNKGEIKLFTKTQFDTKKRSSTAEDPLGKILRSRTTLPGIGDPIIGIDTTQDGKWVVATCKQYLLIVPAETKEGLNGFEDRLGAKKPTPKRLLLKPNDLKRLGGRVSFTPAKFNIAPGDQSETSIVTSSDIYQMQEFNTEIIADQFKFNRDNSIIVTLPNDVCMSKKVYKPQ
ncbi:WD40-like domain-containing protein [Heterostelium album PN500]|uniref:WD40-like domain-containing protein n=1 Tax=Heterostelium pallidum (strain ATCC 26659 / Pp 5 / PN500) TaxID=670386 RepID=D3BRW0_HETP5|nr:WD40-like domain-containing protein [Heterostelium album PN500]EFA76142.1 WD40-like domain-containing protein [Heterostelium album PN500]|eukprot:XP_020428276.1 WD40-like domain-containing protein [Heterostelium album PN500]